MFNTKIVGFESYAPQNPITNEKLSTIVDTSNEWISSRTGITKRFISNGEDTSDIASKVAIKLLEKNNMKASEIDLIVLATITPNYLTPSTACIVQADIGATNAFCFDINAACSGFIYALSIAHKFLKAGSCKNAIVIGAEVLSKIVDWSDRSTCVLFGDGGGGVLIKTTSEDDAILAEDLKSDGKGAEAISGGKLPVINPFTPNESLEDEKYLSMKGREVFNFATKILPKSIQEVLYKANIKLDDIKYIVPHQANSRIIEMASKKLGVSMDKFYLNLQTYGNTSAGSIPIAIAEMYENNLLEKGDKIIITGFGGGLTWGSMLINI